MRLMDKSSRSRSLLAIAIASSPARARQRAARHRYAIPIYARVTRASVLSIREQEFVAASLASANRCSGILRRRIMPNALTPIIVRALGIAAAIIEWRPSRSWASALAAAGRGLDDRDRAQRGVRGAPPDPLPGPAIVITCLAFNLLGDGSGMHFTRG
jgi:peptide/nickel transport system permease protein